MTRDPETGKPGDRGGAGRDGARSFLPFLMSSSAAGRSAPGVGRRDRRGTRTEGRQARDRERRPENPKPADWDSTPPLSSPFPSKFFGFFKVHCGSALPGRRRSNRAVLLEGKRGRQVMRYCRGPPTIIIPEGQKGRMIFHRKFRMVESYLRGCGAVLSGG